MPCGQVRKNAFALRMLRSQIRDRTFTDDTDGLGGICIADQKMVCYMSRHCKSLRKKGCHIASTQKRIAHSCTVQKEVQYTLWRDLTSSLSPVQGGP